MEFEEFRSDHLDTFINFIKLFNVNIITALRDPKSIKQNTERLKHLQRDLDKFVIEYDKKCLKELQQVRVTLPPIIFRKDFQSLYNQKFMRFQKFNYFLKITFMRKESQYCTNAELYKLNGDFKQTSIAFQKLQLIFLNDISSYMLINDQITLKFLQAQAEQFLKEVITIMSGQQCYKCKKFMSFNLNTQTLLPPTIRLPKYHKNSQTKKDDKIIYKYYHETCF